MRKILIFISVLFCCLNVFGQQFTTPRTNPTVTVQDSRMRAQLNFYLPHTHGLTLNGGLDTLGLMEYEDSSGHVWYRDTVFAGGHQWRMFLRTGDATGGVASFNTRTGAVNLTSGDVTTALGYTPPNPNGTNLQYIAGDGSKITFPTIPAQINITDAGLFSHTGTYPNYTFSSATPTQQQTFTQGSTLTTNNFWITGANVLGMTGTSAFGLPTGTTSQRPGSPVAGYTRFNTDSAAQETFNGSIWVKAGTGTGATGVASFNTRTGAVTLSSGDVTTALGYTPINANGSSSQYIAANGTFVTFPTIPAQLNAIQAGLVVITGTYPNLTFTGTIPTFQQTLISGATMTGNNTVATGAFNFLFSGTAALGLPIGNTSQRPGSPAAGYTRFNTDSLAQETYNGSIWVKAGSGGGGGGSGITALTGDGTASGTGSVAFTLATVNSNIGTFNNVTVNGKGLVTAASNVSYLTGNQTITLTGPVTGSGTTTIATTITPVVSAGSCTNCNITFNAAGQITTASNGSGGTGGTNSNVGTGFWIANAGTNNIKTFLSGYGGGWDSATANTLRYTVDSTKFIPYTDTLKFNGVATINYVNSQGFIKTNQSITFTASGDVSGGATGTTSLTPSLTLATVNSNVGAFGSASSVGAFTVNGKGLITAASNTSIQIAESQVTNLVTDLAGKQAALSGTGYLKFSGTTPSYLTPTQVTADLNLFTTSLQGLVPASGGGTTNFLRADGTWAAPPGGGGGSPIVNLGSGYRFVNYNSQGVKSGLAEYGILLDSATTNSIGFKADTATLFAAVRATIPGATPDTILVNNIGAGIRTGYAVGTHTMTLKNLQAAGTLSIVAQTDSSLLLTAVDSALVPGALLTQTIVGTTKYLNLANETASSLLGYNASGVPSVITLGTNLSMSGTTLNATGGGGGISGGNLGSFFRLYVPNSAGIKTEAGINGILIDSSTNANALTFQLDSSKYATLSNVNLNFAPISVGQRITTTVSSNTTLSLATGNVLYMIIVNPSSATSGFQVGTTSTGTDIIPNQNLPTGNNPFTIGYYSQGSTTLFFQGISSSTVITIIKI